MMSIITKSVFGALAGASLMLAVGAASAACGDQFTNLRAEIDAGEFTNAIDRTNLLGKADAAEAKLGLLKVTDALQKLDEIQSKALTLATAPKSKLPLADANAIGAAVDAVKLCINTPQ